MVFIPYNLYFISLH